MKHERVSPSLDREKRRRIDTTRVTLAVGYPRGRGTGLGKVEQREWTLKKLREKFAEPLVDVNTPFSKYLKLSKVAKDLQNPAHKQAADAILGMKMSAGNWTAARYQGKSRKVSDIVAKTMLVLDIDHANPDQVLDIRSGMTPINEFYWLAHTSRSHAPEKPKIRTAFPISREVTPDEGHACLRHLSTYLLDDPEDSIEIVDIVTFRPNQTMFWPSISKGQEYWWDENITGKILDVDEFLGRHPGWEDFTTLPYQTGEKKAGLKDPALKMENPLEKPEPIGAFCRVYSIEDAIETFLPDIYVPSPNASDVRYSYVPGTANNGAVVYDSGLFLLSMHGSDPASGMHNSFDLVRLHKFGHLDEDSHGNTAPGNLPSYKAMVEFCRQDELVVVEEMSRFGGMLDDLEDEADEDEADDPLGDQLDDLEDEDPEIAALLGEEPPKKEKKDKADNKWMANLRRKANGDLEPVLNNITLICSHDLRIAPCIGFNEFTLLPVCLKQVRSPKITLSSAPVQKKDRKHGRRWEDADDAAVLNICSANAKRGGYEVDFPKDKLQDAVLTAGKSNLIHPIKDFIEEQHRRWIEMGRPEGQLETVWIDYLRTPDTAFHRESSKMFTTAAVARIYEPGCKFDAMAIIEGPTGSRKSTFWEVLFGGFCSDLDAELDDTGRLIENMRGWWAKEMAEMKVAKRADSNTLKRTLSATHDQFRMAYGRRENEYPRQNVFVGTSNEDDYLADPTSSRRYWVLRTPTTEDDPIDTDALQASLPLIWGPAYQTYLDMREKQPHGPLWLDLRDPKARKERDLIAEGSRKQTVVEIIAEHIEAWLDERHAAERVLVDEDGMTLNGYEGDDTRMVRNLVTAQDAYEALYRTPALAAYRQADVRTYGKALAKVPGWTTPGKCRRLGKLAVWYHRTSDPGREWITAEEIEAENDLLS